MIRKRNISIFGKTHDATIPDISDHCKSCCSPAVFCFQAVPQSNMPARHLRPVCTSTQFSNVLLNIRFYGPRTVVSPMAVKMERFSGNQKKPMAPLLRLISEQQGDDRPCTTNLLDCWSRSSTLRFLSERRFPCRPVKLCTLLADSAEKHIEIYQFSGTNRSYLLVSDNAEEKYRPLLRDYGRSD